MACHCGDRCADHRHGADRQSGSRSEQTMCRPRDPDDYPDRTGISCGQIAGGSPARIARKAVPVLGPAVCPRCGGGPSVVGKLQQDRKSTRLNSSHMSISYAVFCLKKKKKKIYFFSIIEKKLKAMNNNKN